jgi:hypothetical protein
MGTALGRPAHDNSSTGHTEQFQHSNACSRVLQEDPTPELGKTCTSCALGQMRTNKVGFHA